MEKETLISYLRPRRPQPSPPPPPPPVLCLLHEHDEFSISHLLLTPSSLKDRLIFGPTPPSLKDSSSCIGYNTLNEFKVSILLQAVIKIIRVRTWLLKCYLEEDEQSRPRGRASRATAQGPKFFRGTNIFLVGILVLGILVGLFVVGLIMRNNERRRQKDIERLIRILGHTLTRPPIPIPAYHISKYNGPTFD
ncbi:hypothetical protein LguiB_025994 [Lonicera macranthoides]